jgi:hypothetical protein
VIQGDFVGSDENARNLSEQVQNIMGNQGVLR